MPTAPLPALGPVAAAYLRYLDELEAARDVFVSERAALFDALGERMHEGAVERALNVVAIKRDDKAGEVDVQIDGEYVKRRKDGGDKRSSGFSVHVGSFRGQLGAQTTLWFHMRLSAARRKEFAIDELEKQVGAAAPAIADGMWLYFPLTIQPVDAIDLAALGDAASVLPERFAIADRWLATRYPI